MSFIELHNISKSYITRAGSLDILNNVDLTIEKGDFNVILGPSGSGKTTFLNMVTGIDKPTSGQVVVDSVNITKKRNLITWRGRNIGIIFQQFQLLPTLTVLENVIMPMDFCNVYRPNERRDKAMALLEQFDIGEQAHKTPDLLSGGQQQRVAIARALANDPPLIIGDEPTANLDRMSAGVVFDTFHDLAKQGTTVILVTHDRELAMTGPNLLILQQGEITRTTAEEASKRRTTELRKLSTQDLKKLSTNEMKQLTLEQ